MVSAFMVIWVIKLPVRQLVKKDIGYIHIKRNNINMFTLLVFLDFLKK